MGVSTDAIIAFGFDLGEDLPDAWAEIEEFDFDELRADELGLQKPEHRDYKKDWPEYWKKKTAILPTHAADLIYHCSGEYPMHFLAVNGTNIRASRGSPEALPSDLMTSLAPKKIAALREFCQRHNIEWQEPAWYLFSYWG